VGYPTRIITRWRRSAPAIAFRYFFFDDISADPAWTRDQILSYLGADPEKDSGELAAGHNRKSSASKLEMTDQVRSVLVEHFRGEILDCAKVFSGHAETWAANYGL
jgi:hypothetical protein